MYKNQKWLIATVGPISFMQILFLFCEEYGAAKILHLENL